MEDRFRLALAALSMCGCSLFDAAGGSDERAADGAPVEVADAATDAATTCRVIDDFEDGVTGAPWQAFDNGDATVSETAGALRVSFAGSAEAFAGYDLRDRIDFTEGEVRVELQGAGGAYTGFDVCFGDMELALYVEDGENLIGEVLGTDSADEGGEIGYQPAIHRVLRIRSGEGTVYWEVSDTGDAWDTIHTQAAPFPLDDVAVTVEAGGTMSDPPAAFESFAATPTGCAQ